MPPILDALYTLSIHGLLLCYTYMQAMASLPNVIEVNCPKPRSEASVDTVCGSTDFFIVSLELIHTYTI